MSRTQYYAAMTLDGFIAESDDSLDWLTGYSGSYDGPEAEPGGRQGYERFYEGVGALVMGATTYEWVLDELDTWPYEGKPCWVLSSRDLPQPPNGEVHVARVAVAEIHDEVVAAAGERNVWIVGGGNVVSQYADAGLLDDVIVTVVPVVLGEGKPLFDRRLPGGAMQLIGSRTFDSGMVELSYEVGAGGS